MSDQLSKRYLHTGAAPISPCASIQAQAAPREYPAIESAAAPVEVELPEPVSSVALAAWGPKPDYYTADQMRDYARAAIAALQPGEAVAWRRDTPYGIGYSFASEDVMRDMADWLAPTTPPSLPAGWVLVPERMHVPADAWESAAFSFGGPAAGDGEAYLDCTLWVGNIENDDGTKTYGLHVSCDECPEEGMTTLAEFAAAPQPQREASEAGQGVDSE